MYSTETHPVDLFRLFGSYVKWSVVKAIKVSKNANCMTTNSCASAASQQRNWLQCLLAWSVTGKYTKKSIQDKLLMVCCFWTGHSLTMFSWHKHIFHKHCLYSLSLPSRFPIYSQPPFLPLHSPVSKSIKIY